MHVNSVVLSAVHITALVQDVNMQDVQRMPLHYVIVVTWGDLPDMWPCPMPKACRLGPRSHISGKSRVHTLQLMCS